MLTKEEKIEVYTYLYLLWLSERGNFCVCPELAVTLYMYSIKAYGNIYVKKYCLPEWYAQQPSNIFIIEKNWLGLWWKLDDPERGRAIERAILLTEKLIS